MESLKDRFIRYAKIGTDSCTESSTFPSTKEQIAMLTMLKDELIALGLSDVTMDENSYVMATLPSNVDKVVPTIGFIAHVDTSPDLTGHNVKPQVVESYNGADIRLNEDVVMRVSDFPQLINYIGQTLITTDGTTLLGADDKAGVAEIMDALQYLVANPNIKHGDIKVGFTPDEEIGAGVDYFNVERFGARYAYTMDGSSLGEIEYENFNGAIANITINGRNVHPGYAKDKMINALTVAQKLDSLIPCAQRPEHTEGREGFFHLLTINGNVDSAKMTYIIRDHSMECFKARKAKMECVVDAINRLYGYKIAELDMKDQYYNMYEVVSKDIKVVDIAVKSMENLGITPVIKAIRGGTDGSRLSFMGLPCPNIFAGGENFHSRYEFASLQTMQKASELIVEISKVWAEI